MLCEELGVDKPRVTEACENEHHERGNVGKKALPMT